MRIWGVGLDELTFERPVSSKAAASSGSRQGGPRYYPEFSPLSRPTWIGPALLTSWLPVESTELFVIVEGLIRVGVFIGYILLISLLPDLRRVFQYHGAEHKSINALEAGAELTPANVQKFSLIHPRCGTAFLLWVMVIAIFVFALVGRPERPLQPSARHTPYRA